jgi:hypothetical protein
MSGLLFTSPNVLRGRNSRTGEYHERSLIHNTTHRNSLYLRWQDCGKMYLSMLGVVQPVHEL